MKLVVDLSLLYMERTSALFVSFGHKHVFHSTIVLIAHLSRYQILPINQLIWINWLKRQKTRTFISTFCELRQIWWLINNQSNDECLNNQKVKWMYGREWGQTYLAQKTTNSGMFCPAFYNISSNLNIFTKRIKSIDF